MKQLIIDHNNGHKSIYNLIDVSDKNLPIAYREGADERLVQSLEYCRKNKLRVKLNYGDTSTGKSWNEENDITGYIGLCRGKSALFPILLNNANSTGGGEIMTDSILQIKESKGSRIIYQSKNFAPSIIEIKTGSDIPEYAYELWVNNQLYSRHKSLKSAEILKRKIS